MRKKRPKKYLALAMLVLVVVSCASGCVNTRPYAASQSVACFTNAVWAKDDDGKWHMVSADWNFEPELTADDIRYQFREGRALTPGYFADVLKRLGD